MMAQSSDSWTQLVLGNPLCFSVSEEHLVDLSTYITKINIEIFIIINPFETESRLNNI
jgi:hypothetical protein